MTEPEMGHSAEVTQEWAAANSQEWAAELQSAYARTRRQHIENLPELLMPFRERTADAATPAD